MKLLMVPLRCTKSTIPSPMKILDSSIDSAMSVLAFFPFLGLSLIYSKYKRFKISYFYHF